MAAIVGRRRAPRICRFLRSKAALAEVALAKPFIIVWDSLVNALAIILLDQFSKPNILFERIEGQ